jgi:hypothetical protein
MDFFIKRYATLPILKLELIHDGRNDYRKFHELIQNSNITFCMTEISTGIKRIGNKKALCLVKESIEDSTEEEYYIGYQFTSKETSKPGIFKGEFTIEFLDNYGTLIVPIRDTLKINIID